MNFREMTDEDIEAVKNRSISRGILNKQPDRIDYNFTLEHEDKILVVGGIRLINATTAWGWIDLTADAGKHIIEVYRVIKEWMAKLAKIHKLIRLQAYVQSDFPEAIRTVEHLGFHYENFMPNFVGDKTALMYVKFFGD